MLDVGLVRLRVVLAVEVGAPVRSNELIEAARWARTHQQWEPMRAVFERAWEDVPGPETGLWFGEALYWTRRMPEAEAVLAAGELLCATDSERVALATVRARTLEIGLGRPSEAEALRQSRLDSVSDPAARLEMACAQCERWMFDGEVDQILAVLASARDLSATGHVDAAFDASRYRLTQSTVGALGLNGQFAEMTAEYQLHLQLAIDHELTHPLAREVVDPWWVSGNPTAGRIDTVVDVIPIGTPLRWLSVTGSRVHCGPCRRRSNVDQNGALSRSTPGLVTTSQLIPFVPGGRYTVTFDRDISTIRPTA